MARRYIVDSTETQVETSAVSKILITVNATLTGTIKVIDGLSGTVANVATITNPTVGSSYEYWNFATGVRIIASGACDITVNVDSGRSL